MPAASPDQSFHRVTDGSRLLGFVAIDSTVSGRARGGLRIASGLQEREVQTAARAMTLKYGLLGLPQGGAKAGVVGDGDAPLESRRQCLLEFARAAGDLLRERRYVPDADLGTSAADVRWMMLGIGASVGPRDWCENRSGHYTAVSVLAAASALRSRRSASLAGCSVAIEGFGKVGSALARLLEARGARVVAISTSRGALHREEGLDVARLAQRASEVGSRFVEDEPGWLERSALLELPVDLLFPCARSHGIHAGNATRVAAAAVCAGANDPVSPEAEEILRDRGIRYPPDFVSSCGGVLGGTLEFAGVRPGRIETLIEQRVQAYVLGLLHRADRDRCSPRRIAEAEALARHSAVRSATEQPALRRRIFALGIEAYRRGWLPQRLTGALAPRHVARELG